MEVLSLLIEEYFQLIHDAIPTSTVVQEFIRISEKPGPYECFIRGEVKFTDASVLYLREDVTVETIIDGEMYSYQYMDASNNLIFRYGNKLSCIEIA